MKFTLNNDEWEIKEVDSQKLLNKYNKEFETDSTFCFGVTLYPRHEIWINKEMCDEQKIKTLKHELAHVWLYENGHPYQVGGCFTYEDMCEYIAFSNRFVFDISEMYKIRKDW